MKVSAAKIYIPEEDRREILGRVEECLSSGQLTLGKNGKEFEEMFAEYLGVKYAIAVNSGTSAIEIPMRILSVEGREVIVPTNTFFATPAAVIHAGGKVRFVDADPETFSIDIENLKKNINDNTAGVVIVHIGGIITPRMEDIKKVCEVNNLFLFEDAAHAHGSTLNGRQAGTFGIAASFSFYPTKVMTSAEGGMIVTNSKEIRDEVLIYRDQGKAGFLANLHEKLGYNWRMSELHAIVGLSQLKRLDQFIEVRSKIARIYDEGLESIPRVLPLRLPEVVRSNYYKYIALLEGNVDRATLKKELREKYEIGLSGEVYELPCHLQPIFRELCGNSEGDFTKAEEICRKHICLPISAVMTDEEAKYVLSSLKEVMTKGGL